jgi:hypothetical protein
MVMKNGVIPKDFLDEQSLVKHARHNLYHALESDEPDIKGPELILKLQDDIRCLQ